MVAVRDADLRIRQSRQLAAEHERRDSREVALESERLKLEHDVHVLLERLGHAHRCVRHGQQRFRLLLGTLDSPLDLAHVIQILVEAHTVAGADARLQVAEIVGDEVQQAAVGLHPRQTTFARPAAAKQPLEHDPRVDFHWQWGRLRLPTQRVHVRATEAGRAIADQTGEVLGRQLDGRECRLLADRSCDKLIDGDAE